MKSYALKGSLILLAMTLFLGWGPGTGQAQEEVTIQGAKLPSNILEVINAELDNPSNPGVHEVQFRDLDLTNDEAASLFLSTDLKALGDSLKDGQHVRFRGTVDSQPFDARVEQHEDGLRARIEGMDVSGMTPQEFTDLATNNALDRLRIRGSNGERVEIKRRDDGTLRAEFREMNVSEYTPDQLMSLAVENEFDRLRIRGTDGERYEIDRKDDGTLRAEFKGMDVSGMTPEQLTDLAKEKGLDRLRIRGSDGQRYEIDRKDDGTLRAEFRGMDVSGMTPEQLTNLANERGLDRVRIRGVDKDGNRVRIEYRQDKGIVKWEGAGRGETEVSRRLNNEHARDRGRDRVERERERFDRSDRRFRGGKGRN